MLYHSRRLALALTKDVGFIRACTNQRQREAGRKASLTKVKGMCYHSRRLALTKDVGFISGHAQTKGRVRACTNQRQREAGRYIGRKASLTKVKGVCYHSRRLALTKAKEVGFLSGHAQTKGRGGRAEGITNQSQSQRGQMEGVTITKGRDARWKVSLTKAKEVGFIRACTNQRQRGQTAEVSLH